MRDSLQVARGGIDALATGECYHQGNLALVCDFEEFGDDTPLNRVLRAAALAVGASTELSSTLRRRATAVLSRMEGVGPLQTADLRVTLDRRTAHCRDALFLARNVLANIRRTLDHGEEPAWTFLIRTPELVETGVRNELRERLDTRWNLRKQTIRLVGARMSVAPDLLFGYGDAVGDVKYKLASPRWLRADLYEVVAFATAAATSRAAIIGFRRGDNPQPPAVGVGATQVRYFGWLCDDAVNPVHSANAAARSAASGGMAPS